MIDFLLSKNLNRKTVDDQRGNVFRAYDDYKEEKILKRSGDLGGKHGNSVCSHETSVLSRKSDGKSHMNNNKFSGMLPMSLGDCESLMDLRLFSNRLTGGVPDTISQLKNLKRLWLNDNFLTGPLPARIGGCTSLVECFLMNNRLAGRIPEDILNCTKLELLCLQNNQLEGITDASEIIRECFGTFITLKLDLGC